MQPALSYRKKTFNLEEKRTIPEPAICRAQHHD